MSGAIKSIDCTDQVAAVLVDSNYAHDSLQLCRPDGCAVVHETKSRVRGAAGVLDDGSWI